MTEQSFKAVLAGCRKIVEGEKENRWRDFTLQVIDRWMEEPDVDKAWNAILRATPTDDGKPVSPFPLIEWVLDQAVKQKRLREDVIQKSEALEDRILADAERNWRESKQPGMAALAMVAADKTFKAMEHREKRQRILGRQPKFAPRNDFIRSCREMLLMNCGKPLDDVVVLLASVVTGEALSRQHVKDAFKPTTRNGRDTRGRK